MAEKSTQVAIIGCGITGIATAYYLSTTCQMTDITLVDAAQAMSFTSAQSGENYRNWWPHPAMVSFTNRSIDLMEEISIRSNDQINMHRRGYALSTRQANIDELITQLHTGLGDRASSLIRFHPHRYSPDYQPPTSADWRSAPSGVDILQSQDLIKQTFPGYDNSVRNVIHIRRGGDISSQQLGSFMLEAIRARGGKRLDGQVEAITQGSQYTLSVATADGSVQLHTEKLVNAAGPFADEIARMIGVELPVHNTFQQKIAFEDTAHSIPRDMPFSIDLDSQHIDWADDDRQLLLDDQQFAWLAQEMPGSIHCRPDGGDTGNWVKLGWAYNSTPQTASRELPLDQHFPEIVLHGAARLNPSLKAYYNRLPRNTRHYGGWYTMTTENWPLIGPMGPEGSYINGAMSGFGTMAACAAGELCAATVSESELPDYASAFSLQRYDDPVLMQHLYESNKGVL